MQVWLRFGLTSVLFAAWQPTIAQDAPQMMDKAQAGESLHEQHDTGRCLQDGVAIGGYDLVSYHVDGGPIMGVSEYAVVLDEASYLFSSAENRDTFMADPTAYLPAYSGFCAITLALGRITCPEYTNFQIENGQLLLFEVTGFTNGRTLWNTDADNFREQANTNFEKLLELK